MAKNIVEKYKSSSILKPKDKKTKKSVSKEKDTLSDEKNIWDKSVKVEENGYYWKEDPIITKGILIEDDRPIVVELFSGCGGTSVGFEMAGFKIAIGCDIHHPSIETFKNNHKGVTTILGDVKKVESKAIKEIVGNRSIDVLIAGVPCQGFSLNNRKRNHDDERNLLYKEFVRFVKELKPRSLVLENVSGMKSTGNFVKRIEEELSEASGMVVKSKLLFAPDYGVPQSRTRLVFVGVEGGKVFNFNSIKKTNGPDTDIPYVTIKEAIGDLPSLLPSKSSKKYKTLPFSDYQKLMRGDLKDNQLTNHKAPNHPKDVIKKIRNTIPGDPMYPKFKQRIRLSWDIQSPTQVSGGIRPQFQFGHPSDNRGLTIRERCRLQSFPDNFVVSGGIVQGRVQTGNAVPPLLAKAIALSIKQYLNQETTMKYRIWFSTESFADFIIANTELRNKDFEKRKLYESDANNSKNFHSLPDHIKQILYLDAPDLIVELDTEPIFSIEVTTEAGTGHNAFQRFARLAASVENNVPAFYIYPEAVIIRRVKNHTTKWDTINPLVFKALDDVMEIYKIPALLYYFPSDYRTHPDPLTAPHSRSKGLIFDSNRGFAGCPDGNHPEMQDAFSSMNEIIEVVERHGVIKGREKLLGKRVLMARKNFMNREFTLKGGNNNMSPLTATITIDTEYLLNHLSQYERGGYRIGELLRSRRETIIYKIDAGFRGDPYPGAVAAIDYLLCREGRTFEDRKYNLVLAWGNLTIDDEGKNLNLTSSKSTITDFVKDVKSSESKNLLTKNYNQISSDQIPRYYMQVRYGSTFSKVKHIRVFSYFADAILFPDGALWRDA